MHYWKCAVVTAVLFVTGAATARADVRYVSPGGSGDCTASSPCGFDTARMQAVDGDVLQLAAGDYQLDTDQAFGARVTIEGLRGSRPVLNVRSLRLNAPGSVLRDVTVVGTGKQVLHGVGAVIDRVDASDGGPNADAHTVCTFDGPGTVITDSACHSNADAGAIALNVWFGQPAGDGDFQLRNVTALSPTLALVVFGSDGHTTTGRVTNSIVAGPFARITPGVTVDHSVFTMAALPDDPDVFGASVDSMFGAPFTSLQPVATSPTIDAGSPSASQWDLAGNPRTTGATPDLGALEWVSRAPVATTGDVGGTGTDTASVRGTVDAGGATTSYRFEYGTTAGYGASTPEQTAGVRTTPVSIRYTTLGALAPATTYHYRLVATNAHGTSVGQDRTFATTARPEPARVTPPKVTISLPSNARCRASRTQTIRVRIAKGGAIKAAEIWVNRHRKRRVTKAKDLQRPIKVTKLPKARYRLELRVLTKDGRTVKAARNYRTCTAHR
jgi:hypothetical protein